MFDFGFPKNIAQFRPRDPLTANLKLVRWSLPGQVRGLKMTLLVSVQSYINPLASDKNKLFKKFTFPVINQSDAETKEVLSNF